MEDDVKIVSSLDAIVALVKFNDDKEKERGAGGRGEGSKGSK